MPAQGLYWCQASATMSFFGNISMSTKLLQLSRLEPLEVIRWSEIWHGFTLKCWIASISWRQKSSCRFESSCRTDEQVVTEMRISEHRAEDQRADRDGQQMDDLRSEPCCGVTCDVYETTQPLAISLDTIWCWGHPSSLPDGRSWSCGPMSHEPGGCAADSCCLFLISAGLIPQVSLRRNDVTFVGAVTFFLLSNATLF